MWSDKDIFKRRSIKMIFFLKWYLYRFVVFDFTCSKIFRLFSIFNDFVLPVRFSSIQDINHFTGKVMFLLILKCSFLQSMFVYML